jgi:hypothetical protein
MTDNIRAAYFKGKPVLSDAQLLNELFIKIEKKSVGTTIRKIVEGKTTSKWEALKGFSSLLTHIFVECEHGNTEYELLVENVMSKIWTLL